jgi:hypothetical protein
MNVPELTPNRRRVHVAELSRFEQEKVPIASLGRVLIRLADEVEEVPISFGTNLMPFQQVSIQVGIHLKEILLAQIAQLQLMVSRMDSGTTLEKELETSRKEVSELSRKIKEQDCLIKGSTEAKSLSEHKIGEKEAA